ncbi:hypothetical protein KQH62_04970 [bacterium]|nr:hypothetical protein [bacterium]
METTDKNNQKPKLSQNNKKTLWIVLGALAGIGCLGVLVVGAVLLLGGLAYAGTANLSESGRTTRENPIPLGEIIEYEGLAVVIHKVNTTTYTEGGEYYSLDSFRVYAEGTLSCTRSKGETCVIDGVDASLSLTDTALNLRSDTLDDGVTLSGGASMTFRLFTTRWLSKGEDHLSGSAIKLRVLQEGQAIGHTMWFDTGYE